MTKQNKVCRISGLSDDRVMHEPEAKMIKAHECLGLEAAAADDVAEELSVLLKDTMTVTEALKLIAEKYDAKVVLVGMRIMQLMLLNDKEISDRAENAGGRKVLKPPGDPRWN